MAQLAGDDLKTAMTLLLESYDRPSLEELIRVRFSLRLEWIVRDAGLAEQVAELFDFAARHRLSGRILKEAYEYPPPRLKLRPLAEKYPPDPDEPARPVAALVDEAVVAFEEVPVLLSQGEARARFTPFTTAYQEAATHIDLLGRYKALHDCLHVIQLQYREIGRAAEALAEDSREAASLNGYADRLEDAAAPIDERLAGVPNQPPEQTWVRNLRRAIDSLRQAATSRDSGPAEEAIRLLGRILDRDPGRIHGLVLRQSEAIPLPALIFSLRVIWETPGGRGQQRLAGGLTALEALQLRLARLVAEHTAWQNLDNSLRVALESWYELLATDRRRAAERTRGLATIGTGATVMAEDDDSQTVYAQRLLEDWPDVHARFNEVRDLAPSTRRLERLVRYADDLAASAAVFNFGGVFDAFEPFSQLALSRFVEVDKELMNLAEKLTRIGEPIQAILGVIRP